MPCLKCASSLIVACIVTVPLDGDAIAAKRIGKYKKWAAYVEKRDGSKLCILEADPVKEAGRYQRRGDTYLQVHTRSAKFLRSVIVVAGYTYKRGRRVDIRIDKRKFRLPTKKDYAHTRNASQYARLVAAMKKGRRMVVKGTSSRGTLTTDTYSLNGFSAALRSARRACRN